MSKLSLTTKLSTICMKCTLKHQLMTSLGKEITLIKHVNIDCDWNENSTCHEWEV